MRRKNPKQIRRVDGKNVFFEVMSNAFEIGKVQVNFIEYNDQHKQTKNIQLYVDIPKFLALINDTMTGKLVVLAKQAREEQKKGDYKYPKEIWIDQGGISVKNLAKRNQSRTDGKALSRVMKITPGDKYPWIFSAEIGAGEEMETGLIKQADRPDEVVRVPVNDELLKELMLTVENHINGFIATVYNEQRIRECAEQMIKTKKTKITELLDKAKQAGQTERVNVLGEALQILNTEPINQ